MHNNENCLDYYWKLLKGVSPDKYGKSVYNLINTHRMARKGNLSGMKFDGIDFGNVPLNDLHFDNGGKSASPHFRPARLPFRRRPVPIRTPVQVPKCQMHPDFVVEQHHDALCPKYA